MNENNEKHDLPAEEAEPGKELSLKYESKKDILRSGVLGASIGLAIIVPGVSGSVVAIIFGLYEKLLYAFGNLVKKFGTCVRFLLPIALGAIVGLVVGFFGVRILLELLPFAIVALFAGLMLGAYPSVTEKLKGEKITPVRVILFAAGFALPVVVSCLSVFVAGEFAPLEDLAPYHYIIFVVLGYAVAVTQLVPGLSATALLMTVGCFTSLMESVSISYWKENPGVFIVYACLIAGFIAGLLTVSKFMTVLIERRPAPTFFTISGLSLGSIVTMFFNSEIVEVYDGWEAPGMWRDICIGIALFILGVIIAYMFVRYERGHSAPEKRI